MQNIFYALCTNVCPSHFYLYFFIFLTYFRKVCYKSKFFSSLFTCCNYNDGEYHILFYLLKAHYIFETIFGDNLLYCLFRWKVKRKSLIINKHEYFVCHIKTMLMPLPKKKKQCLCCFLFKQINPTIRYI
jgi:hypothetical protein